MPSVIACSLILHAEKSFSNSYWIKPDSDCIYHYTIDLEPNGRPIGFKSIGKMVNTIWFRFDSIRFQKDFTVCTVRRNCYLYKGLACIKLRGWCLSKPWGSLKYTNANGAEVIERGLDLDLHYSERRETLQWSLTKNSRRRSDASRCNSCHLAVINMENWSITNGIWVRSWPQLSW